MIYLPQNAAASPPNASSVEIVDSRTGGLPTDKVGFPHPCACITSQRAPMDQTSALFNSTPSPADQSEIKDGSHHDPHFSSGTVSSCSIRPQVIHDLVNDRAAKESYSDHVINGNVYSDPTDSSSTKSSKAFSHLCSDTNNCHLNGLETHAIKVHHEECSKELRIGSSNPRSRPVGSPSSTSSQSSLVTSESFSSQSPSAVSSNDSDHSRSSHLLPNSAAPREPLEHPPVPHGGMPPNQSTISPDLCHLSAPGNLCYSLLRSTSPSILSGPATSVLNDPRHMVQPGMSQSNTQQLTSSSTHVPPMNSTPYQMDLFSPRNPFTLVQTPQLYGYSPAMLTHHPHHVHPHQALPPPASGVLSTPHNMTHPQFAGLLPPIPSPTNVHDPSVTFASHPNPPPLYGPRDPPLGFPGFHVVSPGTPRYMMDTAASRLTDESLPTFLNAAAAPNRLPAHKPVRLTQPKHPLAPHGTPVYFKYGEEHYPEETVPAEYTFTETDGTVCRYITNFLVYNKRGERLLPIEVLDQPRHAALVLYGSLLPAAAMSQTSCRSGKRDAELDLDNMRGEKKRSAVSSGMSTVPKRHTTVNSSGAHSREACRGNVAQTYPVRVELAEWCIDYGQEPSNVPFIWLISRWDVYYRLEKPAGRYIPTFATAKMKFEVSTRVIKTLQHHPDTEYKVLVDLLTAATRLEKSQNRAERRALLKERRACRTRTGDQLESGCSTLKSDISTCCDSMKMCLNSTENGNTRLKNGLHDSIAPITNTSKKKNRNWRIQSLSTPQGTGVILASQDGRPQATTSWGAPYAVDGFKESMLLGLTEFLESQLRNFIDGVGSSSEGGRGCADLLNTPFMRVLRERTALRMEALQLMEAKRRALEVAKSLAEAASGHTMIYGMTHGKNSMEQGSVAGMMTPAAADIVSPNPPHQPMDTASFLQFAAASASGNPNAVQAHTFGLHPNNSRHFFQSIPSVSPQPNRPLQHGASSYFGGMVSPGSGAPSTGLMGPSMLQSKGNGRLIVTNTGIATLKSEIQHLQQLLKDSDDDDDDDPDEERHKEDNERDDNDSGDEDDADDDCEQREGEDARNDVSDHEDARGTVANDGNEMVCTNGSLQGGHSLAAPNKRKNQHTAHLGRSSRIAEHTGKQKAATGGPPLLTPSTSLVDVGFNQTNARLMPMPQYNEPPFIAAPSVSLSNVHAATLCNNSAASVNPMPYVFMNTPHDVDSVSHTSQTQDLHRHHFHRPLSSALDKFIFSHGFTVISDSQQQCSTMPYHLRGHVINVVLAKNIYHILWNQAALAYFFARLLWTKRPQPKHYNFSSWGGRLYYFLVLHSMVQASLYVMSCVLVNMIHLRSRRTQTYFFLPECSP